MNQRIKELKEQATRTAMWIGDPDAGELDAEKFAELIVRETLRVTGAPPSMVKTAKKHFGVE